MKNNPKFHQPPNNYRAKITDLYQREYNMIIMYQESRLTGYRNWHVMPSSGHKGTEIVEICRADNVRPANSFDVDRRMYWMRQGRGRWNSNMPKICMPLFALPVRQTCLDLTFYFSELKRGSLGFKYFYIKIKCFVL